MTVWPASFFFWGASGICRRLQPSSFDSPNQPARTRVVSVWNTTQAPPTTYLGTGTPSTDASVASPRGEEGIYRHFGTGTLPTDTSEASQCGEASSKQPQIGFSLLSLSVLGTGTLPTGTSEASQCGERPAGRSKPGNVLMLLPVFVTATLPTDASEASSRGERPAARSMTGN